MHARFKCSKCSEDFRVQAKYLVDKSALNCPNCNAAFPEAALDKIKEAARLLAEARASLEQPKSPDIVTSRRFYSWEFTLVDD